MLTVDITSCSVGPWGADKDAPKPPTLQKKDEVATTRSWSGRKLGQEHEDLKLQIQQADPCRNL